MTTAGWQSKVRISVQILLSTVVGIVESLLKFRKQKSTLGLFRPQGAVKTGRDGPIRTGDPLVPNQMRYHAALHPVYEKRPAVTYALQGFFISLGRNARLELTAPWATTRCSAN